MKRRNFVGQSTSILMMAMESPNTNSWEQRQVIGATLLAVVNEWLSGLDKVSTCGNLPHMPRSALISIFGGGDSETEKSQSAKICLNFNFWGGVFRNWKVTKCQDLPKFQSSGGVFRNWKVTKCQDLPKFQFSGGGGGYSETEKSQSAKICLNFNFRGGIPKLKSPKVPRSA